MLRALSHHTKKDYFLLNDTHILKNIATHSVHKKKSLKRIILYGYK